MTHVKVCGLMTVAEAVACVEAGARAIGLNFVPQSPRRIGAAEAKVISDAVHAARPETLVVGVVADLPEAELGALTRAAGLDCLQLHGDEPPEALVPFLPHAYKGLRIGGPEDVARAAHYPGEYILVDARVEGALGGTGATFEWSLVAELARARKLLLAGGLRPENVARAVQAVRPYCVDVASGVERAPGVKDLGRVRAFIAAARGA